MPLRTILLRVMLWSLAIAAVTGVVTVLTQSGSLAWRVIGTAITTAVAAGLMLPVSTMVDRQDSRPAGLLGMGALVIEFVLALFLIWEIPRVLWGAYVEEQLGLTMIALGVAAAVAVGLARALARPFAAIAARAGLFLAAIVFPTFLTAVWTPFTGIEYDEKWWETTGALAACGLGRKR